MNKNKLLNFLLSIIVIIIVVVFSVIYYYICDHKAEISIYDELSAPVSNTQNGSLATPEILNIESTEVQTIYPFTGAFPSVDIIPFLKENLGKVENLSNEQILRLGWAKVTKDDWADTYTSEHDTVSIKAEVLDKYIKDIFGNIEYTKSDFSNMEYQVSGDEKPHTNSYEIKYDAETDSYIRNHMPGDGIGETRVYIPNVTAVKIGNYIKIDVKTVIEVPEEVIVKDETTGENINTFKNTVYDKYDFETKTLGNKLLEFTEENISSEEDYKKIYKDIDLSKLNNISFMYELNSETGKYELNEIQK